MMRSEFFKALIGITVGARSIKGRDQKTEEPTNIRSAAEMAMRAFPPLDSTLAAADIVAAGRDTYESLTDPEVDKILRFYRGEEQWSGAVQEQRHRQGRPILTINRIPQYVEIALAHSRKEGKPVLDPIDIRICQVLLTRRLMDAQRLFNYWKSSELEDFIERRSYAKPA